MIIVFSHRYCKMPPGYSESELLQVFKVDVHTLSDQFIKWDTKTCDDKFYALPESGSVLVLILRARSTGLMWTTVRRSTDYKEAYYRSHVGEYVECVVTEAM
jgi:hypothetical protein